MRGLPSIRRLAAAGVVAFAAALATAALVTADGTGPLARWQFDETSGTVAADAVGSLEGTISGATSVADGVVGRAFHFDGTDLVSLPDGPAFHQDVLHLDFFIRADPDALPADGSVIMEKGDILCGDSGAGFALVVDDGAIAIEYRDRNAATQRYRVATWPQPGLGSLWDGAWHHVSFVSLLPDQPGGGFAAISMDGWGRGSSPMSNSDGVDFGDHGADPLVVGGDDEACGANFVGDIDQIRLSDYLIGREEYAEDEPHVATTVTVDEVGPSVVDDATWIDVTLLPAPARPGRFCVFLTAEDGVERQRGCRTLVARELADDGQYRIGFESDYGGEATFRIEFESDWPSQGSSHTNGTVTIAKRSSETRIGTLTTYIADEPIRIGAGVSSDRSIQVTGRAELWEITDGGPVLAASGELLDLDGTITGTFETYLPGRPAGTYRFEARYFGSASFLPSVSAETEVVIEPGLVAGPVVINGGAATTSDPVVSLSMPATGATAIWVSTGSFEGEYFFTDPYDGERDVWLTRTSEGDDRDGVRTVWVRWADILGRWSPTQSDTIVLDRGIPKGTVSINGGAAWTASREVTVAVPIADPSTVLALEVSNDGVTWWSHGYAPTITLTLPEGEGIRTIHVRWKDLAGRSSMPVTDSIVLDAAAPRMSSLTVQQPLGAAVSGRVPMRVAWAGSDQGGGALAFTVQERVGTGPWTTVIASTSTRSTIRSWSSGQRYEYRVRATDQAGKVSAWRTVTARRATAASESSSRLAYRGTWRSSTSTKFWGGTSRWADRAGASVTATVTGRSIAWVSVVGPTRGKAKVYVNGAYVRTVDLYAPTTGAARTVFVQEWSSTATRRVTITVVGTAGRPRVDMDGIISIAMS